MGDPAVTVRELGGLDEFREVERLYDEIWPPAPGQGHAVAAELLRALAHAGNYVAGAYRDGRLVGATVAFFGAPLGETLHSHVTGVLPASGGVGFALKTHQRDWALARGLRRITWTYDPLIRRNAYFNLVKLGARPEEYLPDFYGEMVDRVNEGDPSDRVLAVWELDDPRVRAAVRREPPPAPPCAAGVALAERDGMPVVGRTDAAVVLVGVPADIEAIRRVDATAARAWRLALREVLGGLLAAGGVVVGFDREVGYLVGRR
ncbi:GNAT family N-acetyltransferase [Embleya sp. AB8]|uniref:GNAT family N-acetyltransferase n=1 Tax=Embleya sp. AB8 TaxID=3156304 RepID=UPI003C745E8A